MSIFCIGQAAYDIVFPISEPLEENHKYRVHDKMECAGAPATNAAFLCALWNQETTLFARVGDDFYGRQIKHQLKEVGVCCDHMMQEQGVSSALSCILVNQSNANRTIFNFPSSFKDCNFSFPTRSPDVLHLDGHELSASLEALKRYPKAISVLDAGTLNDATLQLATLVDYLICSESFAFDYTKITIDESKPDTYRHSMEAMKRLNQKKCLITLGERGVLYTSNKETLHFPAYATNSIDTTGAGDVFHGAFSYCLAMGFDVETTLQISCMAASISTQTLGGQRSIPKLEDVQQHLRQT